jgi:hypothetical protein
MKTRARNQRQGGVLVTTLVICMLVGIMLVAYLALVSQQQVFTHRSQMWNHCVPMCEAGVEEALAHLNHAQTGTNFGINGWDFDGAMYRREREMNRGIFHVGIDTSFPPVITAVGELRTPLRKTYVSRGIRVRTRFNQQFPNALLARGGVTLNGSARVDSFNSTNSLESTNGQYLAKLATDHVSIATVSQKPGQLKIGNVSVYGTVATGPGGTVEVGPNGNVGSTTFNDTPTNDGQIQEGHVTDDVNVTINQASLPEGWGSPAPPGSEKIGGTNYNYVLRQGDYQISGNLNLTSAKDTVIVLGKARLYVTGSTTVGGPASIVIANGGSVEWYSGGNVDIGGGGVVNDPGFAKNFSLIGLPSCASVSYDGHARFIGTIYAPDANVAFGGTSDICGSVVGNTISIQGNMQFHYDEALRSNPKFGRFIPESWQELKPEEYAGFLAK